jgi:hypothetical protein
MANHVWTHANVLSEKEEVHKQLSEWFDIPCTWNEAHIRGTVEPIFGKYDNYPREEIGPKWILVEDVNPDAGETGILFCSAWSFADGYMKKFVEKVVEMDEDAIVQFKVDGEGDDFLIGGYGSKNGFTYYEEASPDRPWEEQCEEEGLDYDVEIEKFYDEVIEIQEDMIITSINDVDKGDSLK